MFWCANIPSSFKLKTLIHLDFFFSYRYKLPLDLDPLLVLIGVAPQCDRGVGFEQAIETARACETNFVFDKLPEPPFRNTTSPIPDEEIGPSTASGIKDDDTSLCLDTAISGSDLLSSRQYLSDEMSTPPSSLDQLSLLGESNWRRYCLHFHRPTHFFHHRICPEHTTYLYSRPIRRTSRVSLLTYTNSPTTDSLSSLL